jgi:hypothetical protein
MPGCRSRRDRGDLPGEIQLYEPNAKMRIDAR